MPSEDTPKTPTEPVLDQTESPMENQESESNADETLLRRFDVTVSKEEIEKEVEILAAEYSKKVKLPGFRAGKVPVEVVRKKFHKGLIEEVVEKVVQRHAFERIDKEKWQITSAPVAEKIEHEDGTDLHAEIVTEIFPEIDLPELDSVEVSIPREKLQGEAYDEQAQIDRALQSHERSVPVKDRGAGEGELVVYEIQSKILDTKKMSPKKEGMFLMKKDGESEILDLYPELLEKKPGEAFHFTRSYPDDFRKKAWAGKEVEHYLHVKALYELKKPDLNKEFFASIGVSGDEEFKKRLRDEFDHAQKHRRDDVTIDHIFQELDKRVDFQIPSSLLQQEVRNQLSRQQMIPNFASEEDKVKYRDVLLGSARRTVKMSLMLDAIRKQHKIEVSQEDIQKEYKHLSAHHGVPERDIRKYYSQKEKAQQLKDQLLDKKILDFLREKVRIKEN